MTDTIAKWANLEDEDADTDFAKGYEAARAWVKMQIECELASSPGELCPACASAEFERVSGFGGLT